MFPSLKIFFKVNRLGLICALIVLVYETENYSENYLKNKIILLEDIPILHPVNMSCPFHPRKKENNNFNHDQVFYLLEEDLRLVHYVKLYAPFISFPINGLLSDKYGGHRLAFLGMVISGLVMAVLYWSLTYSFYIFLLMYAMQCFSQGVVWSASVSIIGKLSKPDRRDMSCSFLSAALALSPTLGILSSRIFSSWEVFSVACSLLLFVASILWCILWKYSRFPRIHRPHSNFPWRRMLTSDFFYSVSLLYISMVILHFMVFRSFRTYLMDVVHTTLFEDDHGFIMLLSVGSVFSSLLCGLTINYFASKSLLPTSTTRKIFTFLAYVTIFFSLTLMVVEGCSRVVGLASWITCSMAIFVLLTTTMAVIIDMIPTFASTLFGFEMLFSYVTVEIIMVNTEYLFISNIQSLRQWQATFFIWFILAAILLLHFLFSKPTKFYFLEYRPSLPQIPEQKDMSSDKNVAS